MKPRRLGAITVGLLAVIALAACSTRAPDTTGPAATTTPVVTPSTSSTPAAPPGSGLPGAPELPPLESSAPSSPAPLASAVADLLSHHADPELEAMLPDQVRGIPLEKFSLGAGDLGEHSSTAISLLALLGRPPSDFTTASAVDLTNQLGGWLTAVRIDGASASTVATAIVAEEKARTGIDVTATSVDMGGKSVTRVDAGASLIPQFVYASEDVVYLAYGQLETAAALLEGIE